MHAIHPKRGVSADSIPRYAEPDQFDDDSPKMGACWNCAHAAEVRINGVTYSLCALNRDVGAEGDLSLIDANTRGCIDWEDFEG